MLIKGFVNFGKEKLKTLILFGLHYFTYQGQNLSLA